MTSPEDIDLFIIGLFHVPASTSQLIYQILWYVLSCLPPVPLSETGKKGGGCKGGGTTCSGGYKGVRAVRPDSVAGRGWFEVLLNLEYNL